MAGNTPSLRPVLLVTLLSILLAPPALGQPPAAGAPDPVAEELARLNRTLERIVELLERQTEGQRLDLALRRLTVESERVAVLEQELRSAQSTVDSLVDQRAMMQGRFESMLAGAEEIPPDASEEELRQMERMAAEAQAMMERYERQIETQEQRILELRNELTRRRADLQSLQDRLDRDLEGM